MKKVIALLLAVCCMASAAAAIIAAYAGSVALTVTVCPIIVPFSPSSR